MDWHSLCFIPVVTKIRGDLIMRTALNSSSFEYPWPLTVPTPVALTMLVTGTVLVPAVNATFPILAVLIPA